MEIHTTQTQNVIASAKELGVTHLVMLVAMVLAAVVVICSKRPRTSQEWVVGIVSTLISSLCGGSAFIIYLGLEHWVNSYFGLMAVGGILFSCGLPGWALVRLLFNTIEQTKDQTLFDVAKNVKEIM